MAEEFQRRLKELRDKFELEYSATMASRAETHTSPPPKIPAKPLLQLARPLPQLARPLPQLARPLPQLARPPLPQLARPLPQLAKPASLPARPGQMKAEVPATSLFRVALRIYRIGNDDGRWEERCDSSRWIQKLKDTLRENAICELVDEKDAAPATPRFGVVLFISPSPTRMEWDAVHGWLRFAAAGTAGEGPKLGIKFPSIFVIIRPWKGEQMYVWEAPTEERKRWLRDYFVTHHCFATVKGMKMTADHELDIRQLESISRIIDKRIQKWQGKIA